MEVGKQFGDLFGDLAAGSGRDKLVTLEIFVKIEALADGFGDIEALFKESVFSLPEGGKRPGGGYLSGDQGVGMEPLAVGTAGTDGLPEAFDAGGVEAIMFDDDVEFGWADA